jgi:hypothetical protein
MSELWREEVRQLHGSAPTLPRAACDAVRRVLRSLLDEPATEPAAARDIAALLQTILERPPEHAL